MAGFEDRSNEHEIGKLEARYDELVADMAAAAEDGITPEDLRRQFADEREVAVGGLYDQLDHMGG